MQGPSEAIKEDFIYPSLVIVHDLGHVTTHRKHNKVNTYRMLDKLGYLGYITKDFVWGCTTFMFIYIRYISIYTFYIHSYMVLANIFC